MPWRILGSLGLSDARSMSRDKEVVEQSQRALQRDHWLITKEICSGFVDFALIMPWNFSPEFGTWDRHTVGSGLAGRPTVLYIKLNADFTFETDLGLFIIFRKDWSARRKAHMVLTALSWRVGTRRILQRSCRVRALSGEHGVFRGWWNLPFDRETGLIHGRK